MTIPNDTYCAFAHSLDLGEGHVRVAIKDCIDIKDTVSACGSEALRDASKARQDATVVARLLTQDCRIVGKTNMHELAYGMTGVNEAFGTPINPRWPDRIPGGSSSGAAVAVAADLCDFAVGTDTGGSVRQPAICCGVYGIKPTFGRISRDGCHPAQSSLDCVGVFARSMDMLVQGIEAIDPTFERQPAATPPKIGRVACDANAVIDAALDTCFVDCAMVALPLMEAAFQAGMTVIGVEAAQAYGPLLAADKPIGDDVRKRLINAAKITPQAHATAEDIRDKFTQDVDKALETYDVLVTPALPVVPPTLAAAKDPATVLPLTKFLRPFNLSGHPAIVLPFTTDPDALPAGIQLIGRKGEDARLCAIAEQIVSTAPIFQPEKNT